MGLDISMSEETTEKEKSTIIKLDALQFHNLLNSLDYLTKELKELKELKNITSRLVALEGELKLIRIEIMELKQKK